MRESEALRGGVLFSPFGQQAHGGNVMGDQRKINAERPNRYTTT
jgi:hypothetical protein